MQDVHLLQRGAKAGNIPGQQAHSRPLQLWRSELRRVQHCIKHSEPQAACPTIPGFVQRACSRPGLIMKGLTPFYCHLLGPCFLPPGAVTSVVLSSTVTRSPSVSIDVATTCCSTFLFRLQAAQALGSQIVPKDKAFVCIKADPELN